MTSRRDFLRYSIAIPLGIYFLPTNKSFSVDQSMMSEYSALMGNLGFRSPSRLNSSSDARDVRDDMDDVLYEGGFKFGTDGELATNNSSKVPKFSRSSSNLESYLESYVLGHTNGVDVCGPLFTAFSLSKSSDFKSVMLESPMIYGINQAVKSYKSTNSNASNILIRNIFMPIEANVNPGQAARIAPIKYNNGTISNPPRSASEYYTDNGTLETFFTSFGNGATGGLIDVIAKGTINFEESFSIINVGRYFS